MKNEMPVHTNQTISIPYIYKSLPKKLMEESHKVDNKFLNNHLCEIEEAVDKKLMDKTPFINQQIKYHEKSGILNHDNFFHGDLATGTPISNDNFHHSDVVVNPYMVTPAGCTPGDDIELYGAGLGAFGNTNNTHIFIQRSDATEGVIGECYDQIAIEANSSNGLIRMGTYNETTSDEPDVLYAETENTMTSNYAFKSITEFTLTTVPIWFAFMPEGTPGNPNNQLKEYDVVDGLRWYTAYTYGAFPDPADSITWDAKLTGSGLRRMKTGHT